MVVTIGSVLLYPENTYNQPVFHCSWSSIKATMDLRLLFVLLFLCNTKDTSGNAVPVLTTVCHYSYYAYNTPVNRYTDPMLVQCWSIVCDAGPTLSQHWIIVSCLLRSA